MIPIDSTKYPHLISTEDVKDGQVRIKNRTITIMQIVTWIRQGIKREDLCTYFNITEEIVDEALRFAREEINLIIYEGEEK